MEIFNNPVSGGRFGGRGGRSPREGWRVVVRYWYSVTLVNPIGVSRVVENSLLS